MIEGVIFSSVVEQTGNDSALVLPGIQHLSCSAGVTCGKGAARNGFIGVEANKHSWSWCRYRDFLSLSLWVCVWPGDNVSCGRWEQSHGPLAAEDVKRGLIILLPLHPLFFPVWSHSCTSTSQWCGCVEVMQFLESLTVSRLSVSRVSSSQQRLTAKV